MKRCRIIFVSIQKKRNLAEMAIVGDCPATPPSLKNLSSTLRDQSFILRKTVSGIWRMINMIRCQKLGV